MEQNIRALTLVVEAMILAQGGTLYNISNLANMVSKGYAFLWNREIRYSNADDSKMRMRIEATVFHNLCTHYVSIPMSEEDDDTPPPPALKARVT